MKGTFAKLLSAALFVGVMILPASSTAQFHRRSHRNHDQNTWQNLAIGSAAVGVYGAVTGQKDLAVLGGLGALYSGYRYEQDVDNSGHRRYRGYDDRDDRDDWGRNRRFDRDTYVRANDRYRRDDILGRHSDRRDDSYNRDRRDRRDRG